MHFLIIYLLVFCLSTTNSKNIDWRDSQYFGEKDLQLLDGPEKNPICNQSIWPILYPECTGKKQSPINIPTKTLNKAMRIPPLCWNNYETWPLNTTLSNEGRTLDITSVYKPGETPSISCGMLGKSVYEFYKWHCHWGKTNRNGSEHTFNGRHYPMECHFVHFNKAYGTFKNALKYPDGLAVIAYVYDIGLTSTFPQVVLGSALVRIKDETSVPVSPLPLAAYAPIFLKNYVTYSGSLTTPPCYESVTWIINKKAGKISPLLMAKFRYIAKTSECMQDNFRGLQDLNGRDIDFVNGMSGLIFKTNELTES